MPHLLIEILSEEIPARMQARAEADLRKLVFEALSAAGLHPEAIRTFSTPRRLGLAADGLPVATADQVEERKGPRVGAPEAALQGFLRGAGLSSIAEAEVVQDKKGDFYVARVAKKGRETTAVIAEIVPAVIRAFPWPKSMRSGVSDLQWVRPIRNLLVTFDGEPAAVDVDGLPCAAETVGHRFHAPQAFKVRRFDDYEDKLRKAFVILDRDERKATILADAKTLCSARNLELVEDAGLLEEVAGLVEYPVALIGDMDPSFLDLPAEVIRLTMRTHQKYFAVRDPKTGKLAPHFVTVANIEASDGGKAIAAGNARVLSARLNDARFFWAKDLETPLYTEERKEKLKGLVFHARLGSVWDKVERVAALARALAPACGADPELCAQAAYLAKMDLVTETVGEFPELQGQIGRQLYEAGPPPSLPVSGGGVTASSPPARGGMRGGQTPHPSIAAAIEDHYRPLGPNDRVPTDPVAVTLALADKLDSLVAFWSIDEKPTGSGDPYGSRRAALGVVRIVLTHAIRLRPPSSPGGGRGQGEGLRRVLEAHALRRGAIDTSPTDGSGYGIDFPSGHLLEFALSSRGGGFGGGADEAQSFWTGEAETLTHDLLTFLADRLKVQLREQGKRHDLVDAVFAPNPQTGVRDDDLVRIVARVEALSDFLTTDDGKNLLAGYKRAANILAAEEKKEASLAGLLAQTAIDAGLLAEPAEKALHAVLTAAQEAATHAMLQERFADAMKALASLRQPVDAMLDGVLVNAADPGLRLNRLLLLAGIRASLNAVADFSKIEG